MSGKEEVRIFVGGLSWDTTERHLEDAFGRFGKVIEAQMDVLRFRLMSLCSGLMVVILCNYIVENLINEIHQSE